MKREKLIELRWLLLGWIANENIEERNMQHTIWAKMIITMLDSQINEKETTK